MKLPNGPENRSDQSSQPWLGTFSEIDFEIDFCEQILQRQPGYIQVLRLLGELLARKGLHDRTVEVDRRLVNLRPTDEIAHYNLACSLAKNGSTLEAVQALQSALNLGYNDWEHLEVDPDLDSLRVVAAFQELLRQQGVKPTS
jgi:DNA-binding SARP family transcriptional activator